MKSNKKNRKLSLVLCLILGMIFTVGLEKASAEQPMNAKKYVLNGAYSEDQWLTEDTTENWYYIDIPSDGLLELRIMSYCSGSLRFQLFNEDLSENYKFTSCSDYVSGSNGTSPVTGTATKALSKGKYYFKLYNTVGKYKLFGSFKSYGAQDAGADSFDSPYVYQLGTEITGALTHTDTEDWYKVTLPSTGEYTFKMKSYCSDSLDVIIFNSDLSQKLLDTYISGATENSPVALLEQTKVLSAGTYYVKVYGAESGGKYTLSFKGKGQLSKVKCSVTAKKNKKTVTVKTIKGATVTLKYGKQKITKTATSSKVKFKLKSKLKKGKKVKVTVTKQGYNKNTVTVKVK